MSRSSNTPAWIIVLLILSPIIICCCGAAFWLGLFGLDTGFTFNY